MMLVMGKLSGLTIMAPDKSMAPGHLQQASGLTVLRSY